MIIQYPDYRLMIKSSSIVGVSLSGEIIEEILYHLRSGALGIAAPQLGFQYRAIGVKYGMEYLILLNPEIIKRSGKTYASDEQCLSINNGKDNFIVRRDKYIKVKAQTLNGKIGVLKGRDIFGRILQHEIDHLDGILINQKR